MVSSWWMVKPVAAVGVVDNRSNQRRFRLAVATTTLMNTSFLRSRRALNFGAFVVFVVFFPILDDVYLNIMYHNAGKHRCFTWLNNQIWSFSGAFGMVFLLNFVCWESVKRSMLPVSTHWDKPHGPWKCNSGTYGSQKSHPVHPDMRWTWIPWNLSGDLPNHDTFQSNHFNRDIQALLNTAAFHNAFVLSRSQNLVGSPIHQTSNIHFSHMPSTRSSFRMCDFFGLYQEPLPLGRTDDLLQYSQEIWEDLDDASNRVAALHRAEVLSCVFWWEIFGKRLPVRYWVWKV